MIRSSIISIALVVGFLDFWCRPLSAQQVDVTSTDASRIGNPVVEVRPQNSGVASLGLLVDSLVSLPLQINTSLQTGYDDNSRTAQQGSGSIFTSAHVTLAYAREWQSTRIGLVAGGGGAAYSAGNHDLNGFLDFSITHRASRRLVLTLDVYAAYQVEPDFSSDAGPSRRAGNFLQTSTSLSANYQLTHRWNLTSGYSARVVSYDDSATAAFEDRLQQTFSETIHYRVTRTTTFIGTYRLQLTDYDTAPRDSVTNFFLAGLDRSLTRKLKAHLVAGLSLRSFSDANSEADPHVEGSLSYRLTRNSLLRGQMAYSVEDSGTDAAFSRNTFRTGLLLTHSFTGRINSSLSLNYHHDENQSLSATGDLVPSFSEDAFNVSLSVGYHISPGLFLNLRFDHSEIISGQSTDEYSRNRYSCGLTYTF